MQRAVIAIGVKKTGQLPELQAAVESATQFADWARGQAVPASRVRLITDARSVVSRDRIFDAVEKITKLGFIEQLIVYFSGHGINSGMYEQWLLSKAPTDPNAAVNLKGSEFGARFCGISHVVFISDACRTAADSIQAQRVVGGDIFPSLSPSGPGNPVDRFFATLVGHPAYEVKNVEESATRYRAAYSTVLLDALGGRYPGVIESGGDGNFVRPRPLKLHLATAVPDFFTTLKLAGRESSQPDAIIESDHDAWLAKLAAAKSAKAAGPGKKRAGRRRGLGSAAADPELFLPPLNAERLIKLPDIGRRAALDLRSALDLRLPPTRKRLVGRKEAARFGGELLAHRYDAMRAQARIPFGPESIESRCGIKVRGSRIAEAYAKHARVDGSAGDAVAVTLAGARRGANVLIQVTDRSLVVVPVFRDFITGLSFDSDGHLDDVWCEPSANSDRARDYQRSAAEIRSLRAVVAAAAALGVFRIDSTEEANALVDRLRSLKSMDPALAVYAAYALHDRRMPAAIADMQVHMKADLRVRVFDVAMLSFTLNRSWEPDSIYPCVPMLTQGWALLTALGIRLPGGLRELQGELRPSLWTHFGPDAAGRLRQILRDGKVE